MSGGASAADLAALIAAIQSSFDHNATFENATHATNATPAEPPPPAAAVTADHWILALSLGSAGLVVVALVAGLAVAVYKWKQAVEADPDKAAKESKKSLKEHWPEGVQFHKHRCTKCCTWRTGLRIGFAWLAYGIAGFADFWFEPEFPDWFQQDMPVNATNATAAMAGGRNLTTHYEERGYPELAHHAHIHIDPTLPQFKQINATEGWWRVWFNTRNFYVWYDVTAPCGIPMGELLHFWPDECHYGPAGQAPDGRHCLDLVFSCDGDSWAHNLLWQGGGCFLLTMFGVAWLHPHYTSGYISGVAGCFGLLNWHELAAAGRREDPSTPDLWLGLLGITLGSAAGLCMAPCLHRFFRYHVFCLCRTADKGETARLDDCIKKWCRPCCRKRKISPDDFETDAGAKAARESAEADAAEAAADIEQAEAEAAAAAHRKEAEEAEAAAAAARSELKDVEVAKEALAKLESALAVAMEEGRSDPGHFEKIAILEQEVLEAKEILAKELREADSTVAVAEKEAAEAEAAREVAEREAAEAEAAAAVAVAERAEANEQNEQVAELGRFRALFDRIDRDGDGELSLDELRAEFSRLHGVDIGEDEVKRMFEVADVDHDGEIGFNEFVAVMRHAQTTAAQGLDGTANQKYRRWFDRADRGKKGYLTASDLRLLFKKLLKKRLSLEEVQQMLAAADTDVDFAMRGDGKISYQEFARVIEHHMGKANGGVTPESSKGSSIGAMDLLADEPFEPVGPEAAAAQAAMEEAAAEEQRAAERDERRKVAGVQLQRLQAELATLTAELLDKNSAEQEPPCDAVKDRLALAPLPAAPLQRLPPLMMPTMRRENRKVVMEDYMQSATGEIEKRLAKRLALLEPVKLVEDEASAETVASAASEMMAELADEANDASSPDGRQTDNSKALAAEEQQLRQALERYEQYYGVDHPVCGKICLTLARVYAKIPGQLPTAMSYRQRAAEIERKAGGGGGRPESPEVPGKSGPPRRWGDGNGSFVEGM